MDSNGDLLRITGMTHLDLAELRQDLQGAGLDPDDVMKVEDVPRVPGHAYEPGTFAILVDFFKAVTPIIGAVAPVVTAWITTRGPTRRERRAQRSRRGKVDADVDLKEVTGSSAAETGTKVELLLKVGGT